jgi:hypothetical protein
MKEDWAIFSVNGRRKDFVGAKPLYDLTSAKF